MPITFSCSSCNARMTVPDHLAGKRGKCSKCKAAVLVPSANGSSESPPAPPAPTAAVRTPSAPEPTAAGRVTRIPAPPTGGLPPAAPSPSAPEPASAPEPPPASETPADLEAEAAALLSDAPQEQVKVEFIEFNCPQCDEPLKMALELADKRHPCPECRRIIQVPRPKTATPADWRNAGPKLPAGARRNDGPAPEGAWGTGTGGVTRASVESLKEAGVIKEKEKPLTLYQKAQPYLLVGTPILTLLLGSLVLWSWLTRNQEKRAFDEALSIAASKDAPRVLGGEGLMALHGYAGTYYLATDKPGCASLAREQFGKSVVVGKALHTSGSDALLGDLAVTSLTLAGGPDETDTDRKLNWKDTHRLVRAALEGIASQPGRLSALRRVTRRLVELGEIDRVLNLVSSVSTLSGADRAEALAVVGLELNRLGKTEEAQRALNDALAPYEDSRAKTLPPLRAPVVALARLEGKKPPAPGKSLDDQENSVIGEAFALTRQGKPDEARALAGKVPVQGGGRLRALIAIAVAASENKGGKDEILAALDAVAAAGNRPELAWPLLRLVEIGLAAEVPADKLELAIAGITDRDLVAWARLQILHAHLAASRSVESVDLIEKIPTSTVAGLLARLELTRHNTRRDRGWASTIKSWDDGPRALGSLGVALGIQGSS